MMSKNRPRTRFGIAITLILAGLIFLINQQAFAAEGVIFPIIEPGTIGLGNQGLFISSPPANAAFVEIIKILPPLPEEYTDRFDLIFYGPALDITFLNAEKAPVDPWITPSSVYFNLGNFELKLWEDGGTDEIAIWYYDKKLKVWEMCPTRYLSEKQNNGKYDRLSCMIMGNGIYILGKKDVEALYPAVGPSTINLGKQGLFISNPPPNVAFVKIKKLEPPLRSRYTYGIDLAYRGPALKISFMNKNRSVVKPGATLTSVYFNVSEPEVRMWMEGGSDEIAIWYYNESLEEWQKCLTRYIAESQNNQKYDRLACIIMGNGIYVLGKMAFDPVFPLWFKLQGEELEMHNRKFQFY